jgi:2-polyprenyl-6-methoxyphenol hydroxylase-like FAD-dependent oxidoreductase
VTRRAEIVGGGIAGLSAATALARAGWQVRVHEQATELREIGSGIELLENGLRALDALGIPIASLEVSERILSFAVWDERNRPITSSTMSESSRCFMTTRSALHNALLRAATAAGAEIAVGSRVTGATADGRVYLAKGGPVTADIVVGADGIGSRIRTAMGFNSVSRDLRYVSKRTLIPLTADDPRGSFPGYWSRSRRIGVGPCGSGLLYVFLYCRPDDQRGCAIPLDRESWTSSFPRLAHVFGRINDEDVDVRRVWEVICRPWTRGRVALLGDAAHAMAPHLGQAACMAMESAVVLAEIIDQPADVENALHAWEARRRPFVDPARRYGHVYNSFMMGWPARHPALRSTLIHTAYRSRAVRKRIEGAPALAPQGPLTHPVRPPRSDDGHSSDGRKQHRGENDAQATG